MSAADVVIVGGGVAGSALATVLARNGREVRIVEQSHEFRDRVRGEGFVPWGVAETQQLDVHDVLLAAGGHHSGRFILYDPAVPVDVAEGGPLTRARSCRGYRAPST